MIILCFGSEYFGQFQLGCWRFLFNLTHSILLWCSVFLLITYNCLVTLQGGSAIQWLDGTMWNGTDGYYLCWTITVQNAGCLLFTPMGGQLGADYEQYLLEQKLSSLWTWAFLQHLQVCTAPPAPKSPTLHSGTLVSVSYHIPTQEFLFSQALVFIFS